MVHFSTTTSSHPGSLVHSAIAGFSWFLVICLGLLPIADHLLGRSSSLYLPGCITFFVAVASAGVLRKRHPWVKLVLHIYGQIMIWLSISCIAIAAVLFVARS
jgi:hypothetical protein